MITVSLRENMVVAYHGIHESEKLTGNTFEIDLDVRFNEHARTFESIEETVDYEVLNSMVIQCMANATPLIEKVCDSILNLVKERYPFINEVCISIFKLQPPIKDFNGKAGVSMRRSW
ncbi:MAG TPA: dihydroneopterin aldolase [Puia sp.]|nr:dihydroneopterin aldolase [Puia sp.]